MSPGRVRRCASGCRCVILALGAVRDGARLERHERRDLADRGRPGHDDPGRADGDHAVHAGDGGVHAARARSWATSWGATGRSRSAWRSTESARSTTALSPNLAVLLVGWSGIEGIGAVLVVPAIAALTAASYEGKDRALAYALLGGDRRGRGGRRAADRRLGDDGVHMALRVRRRDRRRDRHPAAAWADRAGPGRRSGGRSSTSSASCCRRPAWASIVFAILRSSVWGFVQPRTPPTIGGTEITPLGFSPVPFMVLGGLALLVRRSSAWERAAGPPRPATSSSTRRCCRSRSCGPGSRRWSGSSSSSWARSS